MSQSKFDIETLFTTHPKLFDLAWLFVLFVVGVGNVAANGGGGTTGP